MNKFKQLMYKGAILFLAMMMISCSANNNLLFKSNDKEYDVMDNLLYNQKKMDERIEKEIHNKKYNLNNPLVINNPYLISPLSSIIIFNTEKETSIEMIINDKRYVKFDSSFEHAIPVYGLYDDFENKIVLKDEDNNISEITIKTSKYEGERLNVEKTYDNENEEVYLISPDYSNTSIYDKDGKLLWYLDTLDNEGAVKFLDNGHFLISDPYQGNGGIRINYSSFIEMDYLGKVYNIYLCEYGYHHEIVSIKNDTEYLIPGHDEKSPFMQAILYSVDKETMQIKNIIDFYDVFKKINSKRTDSLLTMNRFNFVINGVDYDEDSGDAVVSIRSLGMLIRINLASQKIKWIFADPKRLSKEFDQYLLKPVNNTRYPYGQHEPVFLSDNIISYHNNDLDFLDSDLSFKHVSNRYSTNEILIINEDNNEVETKWVFDGNKEILSRMSGSFEILENNHKLISYGSAFKKEYRSGHNDLSVGDFKYTEALMMELDQNDNIIWRATLPTVIHKVYKTTFYGNDILLKDLSHKQIKTVANFEIKNYKILDGQYVDKHNGEAYIIDDIYDELKNAQEFKDYFGFNINRAVIISECKTEDSIKILFVDENNNGRIFKYKDENESLPIINSGKYGIQVSGLRGRQKVYIKINDNWYNSKTIIDFE